MTTNHNLPLCQALGWAEGEVLPVLEQDPALAWHLFTGPKQRLHFLALVLALHPQPAPARLLRDAIALPVRDVLPRLGLEESRGMRRVLSRIFGPVIDRDCYRQIATLLREPNTANVLAHASEVTPELLANLVVLPITMRTPVIAQSVGHLPNAAKHVLQWIEIVSARTARWSSDAIQDQLGHCKSLGELKSCLTRLLDALPALAAPPPKAIEHAVRVDSPSLIRRLGKHFSNCLDGFVDAEIDGSNHIYHWRDGPDEAVCEVTRVGNLGWFLANCLGKENTDLAESLRAAIAAEFRTAEIHDMKVVETYDDFFYGIGHHRNGGVNDTGEYAARNRRRLP